MVTKKRAYEHIWLQKYERMSDQLLNWYYFINRFWLKFIHKYDLKEKHKYDYKEKDKHEN